MLQLILQLIEFVSLVLGLDRRVVDDWLDLGAERWALGSLQLHRAAWLAVVA